MKLNRTDGAGPSRRPELDQDDQPPAQRQRLEISSAAEPSMLNLAPAPRRASPGRGRESTSSHLHGMAPWQASGAVEFQSGAPLRTNAGAPSQFFLSSMFGELPRRGADEPVHMYTQRLLTDHSDLTSRFLNELARMRLSRATLSEADRQRMTRLLANARPRGANESSAAYEERKRVLFTQVAARILGTTTRALLEDLVSMTDRRIEGDANRQNVGPMSSDVRASTPDTAMPASRPHAPAPGPSTQPLPSQGAPSDRLHARLPDRPQQPVASAMPSGRARRQPAPPPPGAHERGRAVVSLVGRSAWSSAATAYGRTQSHACSRARAFKPTACAKPGCALRPPACAFARSPAATGSIRYAIWQSPTAAWPPPGAHERGRAVVSLVDRSVWSSAATTYG